MPEIELTESFRAAFTRLDPEIQKKVTKALRVLGDDFRHPSLRSKPVEGAPGIFEARVDRTYRMTYERLPGDVLRMRVVSRHDETLRNP
jgi:mRNA interferase RelE/StbE